MPNRNSSRTFFALPGYAKRTLPIFLFLISFASPSHAQTVTKVAPGDGTLSTAIAAAAPGDILQLSSGGQYTITASPNFAILEKPVDIEAEPGAAKKPILKL